MFTAKHMEKIRSWGTFLILIGGGGFTVAMTLAGKASASKVEQIEHRVTAAEQHFADDDHLIDWLVRATWLQHPELPAPPSRRAP